MRNKLLMSRWGDRDRKKSKKHKMKALTNPNKERDVFKEVHKVRREHQLSRELEKFSQDVEELSSGDITTDILFNQRS